MILLASCKCSRPFSPCIVCVQYRGREEEGGTVMSTVGGGGGGVILSTVGNVK